MKKREELNVEKEESKFAEHNLAEAKYRLDLVNHFISMADTKNSIGIGFTTISTTLLTGVGFSNLTKRIWEQDINCLCIISFCVLTVSLISFVLSIIYYIKSLIPQNDSTDNTNVKHNDSVIKLNSYYYRHISMVNKNIYINNSLNMTVETCANEILEEVYYNSCICNKKMTCFKKGLSFSIVSVLLAIIFLFISIGL